ncbi:hypothetical protein B0T24DRAFT_623562, partial [Lasiosphaeria ovina]
MYRTHTIRTRCTQYLSLGSRWVRLACFCYLCAGWQLAWAMEAASIHGTAAAAAISLGACPPYYPTHLVYNTLLRTARLVPRCLPKGWSKQRDMEAMEALCDRQHRRLDTHATEAIRL